MKEGYYPCNRCLKIMNLPFLTGVAQGNHIGVHLELIICKCVVVLSKYGYV